MLGEKLVIFALNPKLELAAMTLVLTSAPKFLWLVVHFDKQFWFWYETEIVPKNAYSAVWPFLESTLLIVKSVIKVDILPKNQSRFKDLTQN